MSVPDMDLFIRVIIIVIPSIVVLYLLAYLRKIKRPDKVSIFSQVKQFYNDQKESISQFYLKPSEIDTLFVEAGIYLEPGKLRIIRDVIIAFLLVYVHVIHFAAPSGTPYPFGSIAIIGLLFVATMFQAKKPYPIYFILKQLKASYEKKKNKEIFLLQQLVLSEYTGQGKNATPQRIYFLFRYLIRIMNHIRPAMYSFLSEYNEDANNPKKPFDTFARIVGTEEAKNLSEVLYSIDQSSGEDMEVILKTQYEELKTIRQENYRAAMEDRGNIANIIMFAGVTMVIGLAMIIYYLEHQDQMRFLVTNNY